ncbi:MAG: hypothetical protein AAGE65_13315 [Planctomycetota bacterium]
MVESFDFREGERQENLARLEEHLIKHSGRMKDILAKCLAEELPADASPTKVVFTPSDNGYFEINRGEDGAWRWRW